MAEKPEQSEKKDLLTSILDSVKEAVDNAVEMNKKIWDRLLGRKEEGEGEEGEKKGIEKIFDDLLEAHNKLWDSILGRKEGEEGEKKGFDLAQVIKDTRNRIRDFLGMEPLPEPEPKENK
jgi:hypothetical protein